MTNIENILYPEESFRAYKDKLLDKYAEDYGEEYTSLISDRMDNTLYIFESNPVDTLAFALNHESEINNELFLEKLEEEYYEYQKAKRKITNKLKKKYYNYLATYFNISNFPIREDIINLDISSFNFENESKLKSDDTAIEIKDKIRKRREKYLLDCEELNIEPLCDNINIHILEQLSKRLEQERTNYLITKTAYGKRIIKKFKKYNPSISINDIIEIMSQKEVGVANFILNSNYKATASIVYYPIMRNVHHKSLDRMFFHENRHIIEAGIDNVGINLHLGNKYQILNEIRTEKHAIEDADYFKDNVLWSNEEMPQNSYNGYEELFPFTYSFFDDNKHVLDEIAISGDIERLEREFGEKDLNDYDYFLRDLSGILSKNHYKYYPIEKEEEAKVLVNKLHRQK